ncbi:hypothetical protein BVY03_05445, partial [bacterium K02(2017)]
MPAEWEEQKAVLLSWPHNLETWPHQIKKVEQFYYTLIKEIITYQEVWLLIPSLSIKLKIEEELSHIDKNNLKRLKFLHINTHDAWIRDYGPIFLINNKSKLMISNWEFNGWGDKYDEGYFNDNAIPQKIAEQFNIKKTDVNFILEGGSIDVNGLGLLLTSKNCLLNKNRNSKYLQNDIEQILKDNLGVQKVIWVDGEVSGDDTDGHIDDVARFVNKDTIVCAYEDNQKDENYDSLDKIYTQLVEATDQFDQKLNIIKLPMPNPVYFKDKRLPASYANFLITNNKVLV